MLNWKVFGALLLCFTFLSDYRRTPGAEYLRYQGAENLLLRGSLILDSYPPANLGVDKAKFGGHWFSAKSLGDHLLQVPARALVSVIHSENTRFFLARILSTMAIAALVLAMVEFRYGLFVALILLFGTPMWHEVRFTHSDLVAGAILLLAIFSLEKKKFTLSSLLFALGFLVRYQLSIFIAPFLLIYGIRQRLNLNVMKLWLWPALAVVLQLFINWYYFGHPFHFNLKYWAPKSPEVYADQATVFAHNHVLYWSFSTFKDFWKLQWEIQGSSMLKWMFWFYPGLYFLWKKRYPFRLEYMVSLFCFHVYMLGIAFEGFRYWGALCFLSLPVILAVPRMMKIFIFVYGLIVVNGYGEYIYVKTDEHFNLLASKFMLSPWIGYLPIVLILAWLIKERGFQFERKFSFESLAEGSSKEKG